MDDKQGESPAQQNMKAVPERMNIVQEIRDEDVLMGRGRANAQHAGNQYYLALLQAHQSEYNVTDSRHNKGMISKKIYNDIMSRGGRFVMFDRKLCSYVESDYDSIHVKISHALRYRFDRSQIRRSSSQLSTSDEGSSMSSDKKRSSSDLMYGNDSPSKYCTPPMASVESLQYRSPEGSLPMMQRTGTADESIDPLRKIIMAMDNDPFYCSLDNTSSSHLSAALIQPYEFQSTDIQSMYEPLNPGLAANVSLATVPQARANEPSPVASNPGHETQLTEDQECQYNIEDLSFWL
jgi:hypothetical protein